MSKLKALREKRKEQAAAMRTQADKMNAEGYTPTAEDNAAWAAINTDYNATIAAVEREETVDRVDAEIASARDGGRIPPLDAGRDRRGRGGDGASEITEEHKSLAMAAWMRNQLGLAITEDQETACRLTRMNPNASTLSFNLLATHQIGAVQAAMRRGNAIDAHARAIAEFGATMSNQSGPSGGFLVPPLTLIRNLEINMLAFGGMLQSSEIMTTTSGERMGWPTADDTGNKGVRLGSSAAIAPSGGGTGLGTDPTIAQVFWDAYKYYSKPVLVPYELLEDSVFNLPAILGEMLGERLGRVQNDDYTLGTGNDQPKGIIPATTSGYTSGKANQIIADDFMNLEHSIDPAYRTTGCGFMMNDAVLLKVRLLKDGQGNYLYTSGAKFGTPDNINGRNIVINQSMTTLTTTGAKPVLFGQLNKYKIRRVNGIRLYRLEERYRDTDQDGFVALVRADGNLLTAGTMPVKYLTIG